MLCCAAVCLPHLPSLNSTASITYAPILTCSSLPLVESVNRHMIERLWCCEKLLLVQSFCHLLLPHRAAATVQCCIHTNPSTATTCHRSFYHSQLNCYLRSVPFIVACGLVRADSGTAHSFYSCSSLCDSLITVSHTHSTPLHSTHSTPSHQLPSSLS